VGQCCDHAATGRLASNVTGSPTSIRLDRELRESLKRLAKERRWSMSTLIQQVLEAFVSAEDKKKK
jgi:predicted transcriptional regulator